MSIKWMFVLHEYGTTCHGNVPKYDYDDFFAIDVPESAQDEIESMFLSESESICTQEGITMEELSHDPFAYSVQVPREAFTQEMQDYADGSENATFMFIDFERNGNFRIQTEIPDEVKGILGNNMDSVMSKMKLIWTVKYG